MKMFFMIKRIFQSRTFWSILIGILVLVLLAIPFKWNDPWDLGKQLNSDKLAAYGTLVGSLITAITVFLLYWQIQHQIKESKAANAPDLYPCKVSMFTEDRDPHDQLTVPIFRRLSIDDMERYRFPVVKLYNIGLGAAKEVRVKWNYNREEIRQFIYGNYNYSDNRESSFSYDFVITNNFIEIDIPVEYLYTCGRRLNQIKQDTNTILEKGLKPQCYITITFKDIAGQKYSKSFYVFIKANKEFVTFEFGAMQK